MKKSIFTLAICAILLAFSSNIYAKNKVQANCTYKGMPLYGKVKIVPHSADYKVRIVNSFPDLKVQQVNSFANSCGKWQIVDSLQDFSVQIVDNFEDFSIKFVDNFPGV